MHVTFYSDGVKWTRREWADRCDAKMFGDNTCQGVKGHKGTHWYYTPAGWFRQYENDDDPTMSSGIAAESTPPGHPSWISPEVMIVHHFSNFHTDSEVTDPDEIARLNAEDLKEDESLDRPVLFEDMEEDME